MCQELLVLRKLLSVSYCFCSEHNQIRTHKRKSEFKLKFWLNFSSKTWKNFCSQYFLQVRYSVQEKSKWMKELLYSLHVFSAVLVSYRAKTKFVLSILCVSYWLFSRDIHSVTPIVSWYWIQKSKMLLINRHAQNWYWVWQWGFHQRDKMLRIWSPVLPPFSVISSLIAVKVPAYFMLLVSAFLVSLESIKMLWLYLYPMPLIHCYSRTFGCDNLS